MRNESNQFKSPPPSPLSSAESDSRALSILPGLSILARVLSLARPVPGPVKDGEKEVARWIAMALVVVVAAAAAAAAPHPRFTAPRHPLSLATPTALAATTFVVIIKCPAFKFRQLLLSFFGPPIPRVVR